MAKRIIAIDLEGVTVRVATLQMISGKIEIELEQRQADSPETIRDLLADMLAGKMTLTDRVVTALPARVALFRQLRFPFREKRKIEAALPLSFSAQLPISLDDQLLAFLPARACGVNEFKVDAVAVNKRKIMELLESFPEPQQNPGRIDLLPFALLPALNAATGFLICCRVDEIVVALVGDGKIQDYRLLPVTGEISDQEIADFINRQVNQLENRREHDGLPLWLIGSMATDHVRNLLAETGRSIQYPASDVFGTHQPAAMAPVALLALAEVRAKKSSGQLNFRQGEFAARGQLEMLRFKLIVTAIMVLLIAVGSGLSMYFSYLQKSTEQEKMAQHARQLFQQAMPAGSVIVDVPLQMQNYRQQLQSQVQMFGLDGRGAIVVLQEISTAIEPDLRVELQDLNFSAGEVRLGGYADSFDAVNRIAEALSARSLFQSVAIANARLATDNIRVEFELQLIPAARGSQ